MNIIKILIPVIIPLVGVFLTGGFQGFCLNIPSTLLGGFSGKIRSVWIIVKKQLISEGLHYAKCN